MKLDIKREENKYYLSKIDSLKVRNKLDNVLKKDALASGDSYKVRSLYFDSINNIDYSDKLCGREDRKKIRLRLYGSNSDIIKLEIKKKNCEFQNKISLVINKNDALEIVKGNYKVLYNYFDNEDAIYIYNTMTLGCYRPKVMVEYDRIAYVFNEFNTRITFDYNIKSSESDFDLFKENPNYINILNDSTIMEVKYNGNLVTFVSKILSEFNLNSLSYSKYIEARKVFNSFD